MATKKPPARPAPRQPQPARPGSRLAEFASTIGEQQSRGSAEAYGLPFEATPGGGDQGGLSGPRGSARPAPPVNVLSTHAVRPVGAYDVVLREFNAANPLTTPNAQAVAAAASNPSILPVVTVPDGYVFVLRSLNYMVMASFAAPDCVLNSIMFADGQLVPFSMELMAFPASAVNNVAKYYTFPRYNVFDQGAVLQASVFTAIGAFPVGLFWVSFDGTLLPRTDNAELVSQIASRPLRIRG